MVSWFDKDGNIIQWGRKEREKENIWNNIGQAFSTINNRHQATDLGHSHNTNHDKYKKKDKENLERIRGGKLHLTYRGKADKN